MEFNPFKYAGPLGKDDIFVNRAVEIEKITGWIARSQPVALFGERRIGKTSLLNRLQRELGQRPVAYVSLEEIQDDEEFLKWLARQVECREWSTPIDLEPALAKKKPVLFLDEFDKAAFSEGFHSDFFHLLRAWASKGLLALVIASLRPPIALFEQGENVTSPFYNIFQVLEIGPLDEASAEALLARLEGKTRRWKSGWKSEVIGKIGLKPWELQHFGYVAWETLTRDPSAGLEAVLAGYFNQAAATKPARQEASTRPARAAWYQALPPQWIAGLLALGTFFALGGLLTSSALISALGVAAILLAALALIFR